jgi:GNAT superfamily N-acetyltransferase
MSITISTDKTKLDIALIHSYLSKNAYWAIGRTEHEVKRSIDHSLCFGVYEDGQQIGFARVITDYLAIAHICDVFILDQCKGNGYGKELMKAIVEHPELQVVNRWMLGTRDAHGLYKQFGFKEPSHPERWMEKLREPKRS